MVGKAKMSVTAVAIDRVQTVHEPGRIGHNFNFNATVSVSKRKGGALSGEGIDCPDLQWKENIEWFERQRDGSWHFVGRVQKDMYQANPDSNTFRNWNMGRYVLATEDFNHPPQALKEAVQKEGDKGGKHWIAENGFGWTIPVATDRPALGLNPGPSSGGGGGESLVTSSTRRRVIYFDLGFTQNGPRQSATQILESVDGKPTIIEFFHPGIPKTQADDSNRLAAWRARLPAPHH